MTPPSSTTRIERPPSATSQEIDAHVIESLSRLLKRADELGVPFLDLTTIEVDREAGRLVPLQASQRLEGVVVGRKGRNLLTLVTSDPTNIYIHDHIEFVTSGRFRVMPVLGDERQIKLARTFIYDDAVDVRTTPWSQWMKANRLSVETVEVRSLDETSADPDLDQARSQLLIDAVNEILRQAAGSRASDIHLEQVESGLLVRMRIDGVLHKRGVIPRAQARAHVQRVKIMAGIDIGNDRLPAGGRISLTIGGDELDVRVSTVPTRLGENVVMRLMNQKAGRRTLEALGLAPPDRALFSDLISMPHGILLVCGPTGSGKSTTLYSCLEQLHTPLRKILTVEDPVECVMDGISQVQVNMSAREEERRLTFARALKEFLRQDPDVIMVGEIRDGESAQIAVEAALTGHLVLSTVHSNNAVGVITRLKELGVAPYLVANTLIGALAQRLVRVICSECAEPDQPSEALRQELESHGLAGPYNLRLGLGCDDCNDTGYQGRMGLYEVLPVSEEIRLLIEQDRPAVSILQEARRLGMTSLYSDGLRKVAEGITTYDEVLRVTARER